MEQEEFNEILKRYRAGNASEKERKMIDEWYEAMSRQPNPILNEEKESGLEQRIWLAVSDQTSLKKEIKTKIAEKGVVRKIEWLPSYVYKIAAGLLLLFIFSAGWYLRQNTAEVPVVASSSYIEVQTNYGERLTIQLPDESSVVLNGNSRLRYSKHWSSSLPREVWIDGEGFFAVQHKMDNQKFIVHTNDGLNVEVLGTKFNVKSRANASEVLLTEGKVKLNVDNDAQPGVILKPGELATIKKNKLSTRVVEDKHYTSWVRSKLSFDKMTLEELAQIMKETYGVEVAFQNDQLKKRQLSGEISSATIDDILYAVAQTFNIEVTRRDDNSVIFSSK